MDRQKVYRQARDVFGAKAQFVVALEELSEAQKEICKFPAREGRPGASHRGDRGRADYAGAGANALRDRRGSRAGADGQQDREAARAD